MKIILLFTSCFLVCSCATKQDFTVTSYEREGIAFTANYSEHSMTRNPNPPIQNAFQYAGKQAKQAALERGKELSSIVFVSGSGSYSMWSGRFTFDIEGRGVFGKKPFTGIPIDDRAGIAAQVLSSLDHANAATAAIAGAGAGISAYNQQQPQTSGVQLLQNQQQNMQMQRMNNSLHGIDSSLRMMR